jgi:hypothetical protein
MDSNQTPILLESLRSALVRVLSQAISWPSGTLAKNLKAVWGYAPEGAKRRYEAHFVNKLTDCDGENSETDSSLDFAKDCGYISTEQHRGLIQTCAEIGRMLGGMIKKSESFLTS